MQTHKMQKICKLLFITALDTTQHYSQDSSNMKSIYGHIYQYVWCISPC